MWVRLSVVIVLLTAHSVSHSDEIEWYSSVERYDEYGFTLTSDVTLNGGNPREMRYTLRSQVEELVIVAPDTFGDAGLVKAIRITGEDGEVLKEMGGYAPEDYRMYSLSRNQSIVWGYRVNDLLARSAERGDAVAESIDRINLAARVFVLAKSDDFDNENPGFGGERVRLRAQWVNQ